MKSKLLVAVVLAALATVAYAEDRGTPKDVVASYETLADAILALHKTEDNLIRAMLDGHRHAAAAMHKAGQHEGAAAQMSYFANEGDNAIAGVRKRLIDAGQTHNSAGEAKGIYEAGFVVVTREAKKQLLDAVAAYQKAANDGDRTAAFDAFNKAADSLAKK